MSADLEDFLRQTAELRQRKTITERAETAEAHQREVDSRPRQYTDSRRERRVERSRFDQIEAEDEYDGETPILAIEVHDNQPLPSEPVSSDIATKGPPVHQVYAEQSQSNIAARKKASDDALGELMQMLRTPKGVRQAFLMREILNRPKF